MSRGAVGTPSPLEAHAGSAKMIRPPLTRTVTWALLLLSGLHACAESHWAESGEQIPPTQVVTGGAWRVGAREGEHQVVLRSGGTEHVTSTLEVRWVERGCVVRSVRPSDIAPGVWALAVDSVRAVPGGSEVFITGRRDEMRARWTFFLGTPGEIALRQQTLPSRWPRDWIRGFQSERLRPCT